MLLGEETKNSVIARCHQSSRISDFDAFVTEYWPGNAVEKQD